MCNHPHYYVQKVNCSLLLCHPILPPLPFWEAWGQPLIPLLNEILMKVWRAVYKVTIPKSQCSSPLPTFQYRFQDIQYGTNWVCALLHSNLHLLWLVTCSIMNLNGCMLEENISCQTRASEIWYQQEDFCALQGIIIRWNGDTDGEMFFWTI